MTAPAGAAVTGTCRACGGRIRHLGGVSWRHVGRYNTGQHAAQPDRSTREQVREAA